MVRRLPRAEAAHRGRAAKVQRACWRALVAARAVVPSADARVPSVPHGLVGHPQGRVRAEFFNVWRLGSARPGPCSAYPGFTTVSGHLPRFGGAFSCGAEKGMTPDAWQRRHGGVSYPA